uniref:Uncharacterized protein n=1 Tax=Anguilla anguilla TaxID=7936 RepID=A0A0E9UD63_ANGAN
MTGESITKHRKNKAKQVKGQKYRNKPNPSHLQSIALRYPEC